LDHLLPNLRRTDFFFFFPLAEGKKGFSTWVLRMWTSFLRELRCSLSSQQFLSPPFAPEQPDSSSSFPFGGTKTIDAFFPFFLLPKTNAPSLWGSEISSSFVSETCSLSFCFFHWTIFLLSSLNLLVFLPTTGAVLYRTTIFFPRAFLLFFLCRSAYLPLFFFLFRYLSPCRWYSPSMATVSPRDWAPPSPPFVQMTNASSARNRFKPSPFSI